MMTVCAIIFGLIPIMWSSGAGASVMKRIAAPMIGGMASATLLTLFILPIAYGLILQRRAAKEQRAAEVATSPPDESESLPAVTQG